MIYPFYGINPTQADNLFFFLYLFQDLNDVIMSYIFRGVIILEGQDLGAKEVNERRPGYQKGGSHAAPVPGCVGLPIWASWPQLHRSFTPKHPRDLKTPI